MKTRPTETDMLAKAAEIYLQRTRPDSAYALPLFKRRLRGFHHGHDRDVTVELMPSLVLRVRDPRSGQILAQSLPGQIDQLNPVQSVDFDVRRDAIAKDQPQ